MNSQEFFKLPAGSTAHLYSLRNRSGFGVDITDFGGAIVRILTPDRNGKLTDVVLGYADPTNYIENVPFFGALIGRVANRIRHGRFSLDGKEYQLEINDSGGRPNCLHGGQSYGRRLWQIEALDNTSLTLGLDSLDGDAGFPGHVKVSVRYQISEDNALSITYYGVTDAPTVLSMTNHCYFNLSGEASGSCDGHHVIIKANSHTEVDEFLSPTGRNLDVEGTRFDLREGKTFEQIHKDDPRCFDDNFVLSNDASTFKEDVATAWSDLTGIKMTCSTTAPGLQFYMGLYLSGDFKGKTGCWYQGCSAFCMETQLWPDAVNHPNFPSARLNPGDEYKHHTVYKFSTLV